jgi:anaphase-promoting complex subunit 3
MEQAILYNLDNGLHQSAMFLAEQHYFQNTSDDTARLLYAKALLAAGEQLKAHTLTRGSRHVGCAYLYAQTCRALKRYESGINALQAVHYGWKGTAHFYNHTATSRQLKPDAAAISCLLGHLSRLNEQAQAAIRYYVEALNENPYIWEAFEGLLALGVDVQAKNVFKMSDVLATARSKIHQDGSSRSNIEQKTLDDAFSAMTPDVLNQQRAGDFAFQPSLSLAARAGLETPHVPVTPMGPPDGPQRSSFDTIEPVPKPVRPKSRLADLTAPRFGLGRSTAETRASTRTTEPTQAPARRSARLLPNLRTSRASGQTTFKKQTTKQITMAKDTSTPILAEMQSTPTARLRGQSHNTRTSRQNSCTDMSTLGDENRLLAMLRQIGEASFALMKYRCPRAAEQFEALIQKQGPTPYLLSGLARARFEMGEYALAQTVFSQLRRLQPDRVEDLELQSTCLWHLKREVELSFLAHEAMDLDRLAPQAWCVLANCFSLQREHDQALKCITRAIQLDPSFAYAHTLQGHEYAANEEFEKAQAAFRCAIKQDKRHYNAWYGLGMAYMKTGNNQQAEYHFNKAAQINSTNAVLVCCIGIVLERAKRWPEALRQYQRACDLAPTNALARFKKAKALIVARDYNGAMNDLHILKELAPEEANVHFLLGRLYRHFGDKTSAIKHLTTAMNLDSKASHLVKEAIENIDQLEQFP